MISKNWILLAHRHDRTRDRRDVRLLHAPLIAYGSRMVLVLARPIDRILMLAGLLALTAGYIVTGAIVFDCGRWASNWAVCMMLGLFAIRLLPACKSVSLSYAPRNRAGQAVLRDASPTAVRSGQRWTIAIPPAACLLRRSVSGRL
jgi:hypothetical protein